MAKEKRKYCPMSFNVHSPHADEDTYICKKSNCAWWHPGYKECVILILSGDLQEIQNALSVSK